ncbi:MAG: CPBP family intramembrane glutamic endopeptidase [Chloroflexota bacterium]
MFDTELKNELYIQPADTAKWLMFGLFVVAGFLLYFAASAGIGQFAISEDGELATWTIAAIGAANFLCLGGVFAYFGVVRREATAEEVGLYPFRWSWLWFLIGAGIAIAIIPMRAILALAAQLLLEGNLDSVNARGELFTSGGFSAGAFLLALLAIGILAPISEELFFRGLLHTWTMKYLDRFWVRGLITSTLFGLAHFDSLGVTLSAFIMGWVIAYCYEATRSIFMPIVIHIVTNSTAVCLLYIALWAADAGLIPEA